MVEWHGLSLFIRPSYFFSSFYFAQLYFHYAILLNETVYRPTSPFILHASLAITWPPIYPTTFTVECWGNNVSSTSKTFSVHIFGYEFSGKRHNGLWPDCVCNGRAVIYSREYDGDSEATLLHVRLSQSIFCVVKINLILAVRWEIYIINIFTTFWLLNEIIWVWKKWVVVVESVTGWRKYVKWLKKDYVNVLWFTVSSHSLARSTTHPGAHITEPSNKKRRKKKHQRNVYYIVTEADSEKWTELKVSETEKIKILEKGKKIGGNARATNVYNGAMVNGKWVMLVRLW